MKLLCDSSLVIGRYFILFFVGVCLPVAANAQLPAATQIADEMTIGWNIGNSLEVPGGETGWGNPIVTQQLIDAVHNAGFNTLRIPCAWDSHADQTTLEIDPAWLARVKEVVDYGYANSMYVILNSHWDNGWLEENPYYAAQVEVNQKQDAYWTQIANYFQNYDAHLLFAGTNEVHHGYDAPSSENIEVQQSYLQTFVDAVRATGGNNASRTLIVQTYNTNTWHGLDYFTMPSDTISNRLMVEVHHYDPYEFTLITNHTCIYWGSPYPNQSACSWAQESYIDNLFAQVSAKWTSNGIPVIMGEYGAIKRSSLNDRDAIASRAYWLDYSTKAAKNNGVIPIYWDNGSAADNGFALFDRQTGAIVDQGALNALVDTAAGSGTDPNTRPDTIAPVVTAPADMEVTAADDTGIPETDAAIVTFLSSATAMDDMDGPISVITHDAPVRFPLGATTVTFSATDSTGNTGSTQATVTVVPPDGASYTDTSGNGSGSGSGGSGCFIGSVVRQPLKRVASHQ